MRRPHNILIKWLDILDQRRGLNTKKFVYLLYRVYRYNSYPTSRTHEQAGYVQVAGVLLPTPGPHPPPRGRAHEVLEAEKAEAAQNEHGGPGAAGRVPLRPCSRPPLRRKSLRNKMTKHVESQSFQDDAVDVGGIVRSLSELRKLSQQRRYPNGVLPELPSRAAIKAIVESLVATLYPRHFARRSPAR